MATKEERFISNLLYALDNNNVSDKLNKLIKKNIENYFLGKSENIINQQSEDNAVDVGFFENEENSKYIQIEENEKYIITQENREMSYEEFDYMEPNHNDRFDEKSHNRFKAENDMLRKNNDKLIIANNNYKSDFEKLKRENNKLNNEILKVNSILEDYKKNVTEITKQQNVYKIFCSLLPDTKQSLKGIFKEESFVNFIACGTQRGNIDSLFELMKNRVMQDKYVNLEELVEILRYFIFNYNKTSDNATLKIQEVVVGERFDTEKHIRTVKSRPSGVVKKVLVIGYVNALNDRILQKSIVKVD